MTKLVALGWLGSQMLACGGAAAPTGNAGSNAVSGAGAGAQAPAGPGLGTPTGGGAAAGRVANSGGAGRSTQGPALGGAGSSAVGSGAVGGAGAGSPAAASSGASAAGAAGMAGSLAAAGVGGAGLDAGTTDAAVSGGDSDRCNVGKSTGMPPRVLSLSGNTFAHDPTMIEADGVYYRFWTGDNIPSASSTDLTSWRNAPEVYRNGYPAWSREWLAGVPGETFNFPWAPDVSYFNGQYHIYSSFSAKFGDNISCITHLTTDDIANGEWTDHGPVICTEGNEPYNAIDADVELDADGKPYLAFGSFWDGIMATPLTESGDRSGDELTRLAWAREIEAPVLLRRCGYYYLFVTWGLCCPGENRTLEQLSYRVAVGRSENILGPYVDKQGKPLLEGGGTLLVEGGGNYAAAGHSDVLVTGDNIYHLYHAYRRPRGEPELRIAELPFDDQGWPIGTGEP